MNMCQLLGVLMACIAGFIIPTVLVADEKKVASETSNMEGYYASLNEEVNKQDVLVQGMLKGAQDNTQLFTDSQRMQIERAITILDVKKTLYANFYGTETIQKSQAVRDALLQIMSKSDITVADLASLKELVVKEKARLNIK